MIAWFVRNGVAANLLMLVLVLGGIASAVFTKRELFPEFSLDTVVVRVPFLGASPEEVEEQVIIRIEEALQGVNGIKEISSTASEGYGMVAVTVSRGFDIAKVKDEIKTRVDAIPSFPANTERPIIEELLIQKDVINISVYGDTGERELKRIAERIRNELTELPEISQAILQGARQYEISIEVSEESLRRYNLTFDQITAAVRNNSLDLPAGLIRDDGGEIQIRSKEQAYRGEDFEQIPVLAGPDGALVRLRDVATVVDGFEDATIITRFNGQPCAMLLVREVGNENPLKISNAVYQYLEDAKATWIPEGIEAEAWSDRSYYLQGRINMLLSNGAWGFALVLLALALFLRPSLAFFVAIGIPISFLATLAVAPFLGITINLLSLFAFILVLGIVVDDAIVVGESVFTQYQNEGPGVESAISGTLLVSKPVTFAVLTTMVAFIPIYLLPGAIGKFMAVVPGVVIPTLAFSLVQSKLVLPYHLSLCHVGDKHGRSRLNPFSRLQRRFSDGLEAFVRSKYRPFAAAAVRYRYLTVAVFIAGLIFSVGLVLTGVIRFVFFPSVPSDYIIATLSMNEGTPIGETRKALDRIDAALEEVRREEIEAGGLDPVQNKGYFLGFSIVTGGPDAGSFSSGSNIGSMILELAKSETRDSNADIISERWRSKVGGLAGAKQLNFMANATGPVGLPVDVRLTGRNFDQLKAASLAFQDRLRQIDGIYDIRDTYPEGKTELKLRLKDSARGLGLDATDLARQARAAYFGAEAQRVQRDKEDVKVMIRYPQADRESLSSLENMRISTANGGRVPFSEVADIETGFGYPTISRLDRKRVISVQAEADKAVITSDQIKSSIYDEILPEILAQYPGVSPTLGGEAKDMAESRPAILGGALVVLALIYTLLAIPFKSYLQPLIVICVIPFGIGGAILGHLWGPNFERQDLSLLSFMGIIAMAGVVVNDSLVMVERINRLRDQGLPLSAAVLDGASQRFRAVVLTSVTTFVGLVPILFETSLQAQFLIPMATSLAFGVLFATVITLLLVPCVYHILEDLLHLRRAWWDGFTAPFRAKRP